MLDARLNALYRKFSLVFNLKATSFDGFSYLFFLGTVCLAIMFLMQKNLRRPQIRGKSIFRVHASYFCRHNIRQIFYFSSVFLIFKTTLNFLIQVEERNDPALKEELGGVASFFLTSKDGRKPLKEATIKAFLPADMAGLYLIYSILYQKKIG